MNKNENYEENLMEMATGMTDEEVYVMAKGIVNTLYSKKPILDDCGWTPEDLLNHQFAYFYDKQSRGKNSPLTLKEGITKKHLKNLLYFEFNNALNYQIRSNKNQNILNELKTAFTCIDKNDKTEEYGHKLYSKMADELEDFTVTVEDRIEGNSMFKYISNEEDEGYLIEYKGKFHRFSLRSLARLCMKIDSGRRIYPRDLKTYLYEKAPNGVIKTLDLEVISKLLSDLRKDISLNLYNNNMKGELSYE